MESAFNRLALMTPTKPSVEIVSMLRVLLVGSGGFIGSILRYLLSGFVQQSSKSVGFPYGTLAVNIIGCFIIGFLSQLAETRGLFTTESRAFIFIGVLGGFTTFSAFGNETFNLWRDGEALLALTNIAGHLVLALGAVWVGRLLTYQVWG
jgi:fluoride exporter